MSATLEAPAVTSNDLIILIEDREVSLTELASAIPQKAIASAWAAGLIEFGHKTYCVAGPLHQEGSILIIEGGAEWSGPKSIQHAPFAAFASMEIPHCGRYERADVPMEAKTDQKNDRTTYHRLSVKRHEAEELLAMRVRLTDKGLAALSA